MDELEQISSNQDQDMVPSYILRLSREMQITDLKEEIKDLDSSLSPILRRSSGEDQHQ